MIIARGTPHGGSCLYTFAFVFEVKGGRVAASTLVYAALSLCLCLCPSYASAMPARHGCRKVPVAPHRVRGRLTHSPPGPSPPVPHPLAPRRLPPLTLLLADLSLSFHSSVSLRLRSLSLRSLCLCYFFSPPSRASLSLLHLRSRCGRRFFVRSCKRTGQQDLASRTDARLGHREYELGFIILASTRRYSRYIFTHRLSIIVYKFLHLLIPC